ncbi:MAG: hypothetical protein ACM3XS_09875 [Bacteroidota bacterium]
MRRLVWRVLGLGAGLLFALAVLTAAEEGSAVILANPGFETGDRTGWTGYGCRLEVISNDVHGGRYAGKAWLDQDWGGGLFTSFQAPRGRYRVSMWIKANPGAGNRCWAGADKFGGAKINIPVKRVGEWTQISFEVKLRDSSCEIFVWAPKSPGGFILVDDVSLTRLD